MVHTIILIIIHMTHWMNINSIDDCNEYKPSDCMYARRQLSLKQRTKHLSNAEILFTRGTKYLIFFE